MKMNELLAADRVFIGLQANGKKQALRLVADLAARALSLDAQTVLDGLLEREELGSTGIGGGFAIPHARLADIPQVTGLFMRFEQPFTFDAIDDVPVDMFFLLLAPIDAGADHLKALARVSRQFREEQTRARLRLAPDAAACHVILCNGDGTIAQPKPAAKTQKAGYS
ncbi:MAG: transcriptional regulator [Robiginitomaculum sp.]|nr:MAG: transcriptional regulator [Robiginitomaculum sp.]